MKSVLMIGALVPLGVGLEERLKSLHGVMQGGGATGRAIYIEERPN